MWTRTAFLSCVFVVLFICLEVGCKVSTVSASKVDPRLPDLNGDGVVDIFDVTMWATSFLSHPGDPNWNSAADLNYDGVVDVRDAVTLVEDLGKNCRFYDFDDLSGWNVSGGSWSVQNGTLEGSSSQDGLIYIGDAAWKDSVFTAKLKVVGDSPRADAAVAFFSDPNNFYCAGIGGWGHRVSISTRVGGVWRELAFSGDIADVDRDVWHVLTVKVSGGTIMLYLDGSLELSTDDSTFVSGSVGIRIWGSHVIVDYVTTIGTSVSQGHQPALMGTDDIVAPWFTTAGFWEKMTKQLDTIQAYGCDSVNVLMTMQDLTYQTPLGAYSDVLLQLKNQLKQRGMALQLQPFQLDGYSIDGLNSEHTVAWRTDFLNNVGGLQDRWISAGANVIKILQPDLINVFSEFSSWVELSTGTNLQKYISFACKAVDAWRAIKPGLTVAVMGMPFWDLKPLLNAGGIPRSNVLYALHYYYQYRSGYPPSGQAEMIAYYNGDLANAKTLLHKYFLEKEGIQIALDHGFKVWFEALGCNVANPNAVVFAKDATDFCKQYNIGYVTSGSHPYNGYSWMFNSDGTLNDVGRIMLENIKA